MQPVGKKYHIVSWNCRGGAISKIGLNHKDLINQYATNILLIQELGNPKDWEKRLGCGNVITYNVEREKFTYKTCFRIEDGSKSHRCSMGIFAQEDCEIHSETSPFIKRPYIYAIIENHGNKLLIATLHATSDAGHAISQGEINEIIEDLNGFIDSHKLNGWILMGDFNNDAPKLAKQLTDYAFHYVEAATQDSGKTLDYAICSPKTLPISNVKIMDISDPTTSDHRPVSIEIILD